MRALYRLFFILALNPISIRVSGQQLEFGRISNLDTQRIHQWLQEGESLSKSIPDSATVILQRALQASRITDYHNGINKALLQLARTASYSEKLERSNTYIETLLQGNRYLIDSADLAEAYHILSVNNFYLDDLSKAFQQCAIAIQYAVNRPSSLAYMYNTFGEILSQLSQKEKAQPYFDSAILLGKCTGQTQAVIAAYINRGKTLTSLGDTRQAVQTFDSAISWAKKYSQHESLLMTSILQANLLNIIGQYMQALAVINEAQTFRRENDLIDYHRAYLLDMIAADAHTKLGQYKQAEVALLKAQQMQTNHHVSLNDQAYIIHRLSEVYYATGRYKAAYDLHLESHQLLDSIKSQTVQENVYKLETQYRTAEKDKVIAEKQVLLLAAQQQAKNKNMWLMGLAGGALLLCLTFITLFQRQRLKLQKARTGQQQRQIEKLQAVVDGEEKERVRIGRQLHDDVMVSFSIAKINLAALPIAYPAIKSSAAFENLSRQLNQTGVKIRQTAHNLMPDALLTEGLLFAISYFCNGINKSGELQVRFQHYGTLPDLPTETQVNLYRIVQELVQNVVKHAHASEALVQLYSREDAISITVDDDGRGIADPEKAEAGLGLKSIRSRLRVMGGEMDIRSVAPHGTAVHIEVSLENEARRAFGGNS